MKVTLTPIRDGDKEIHLVVDGVDVWVDYDDVDQNDAKRVTETIQRLPELLKFEREQLSAIGIRNGKALGLH